MNWVIGGYEICPQKISAISRDGSASNELTTLVYMDGGHILTLTKEDGELLRGAWSKGSGGRLDLRRRAEAAKARGAHG